MKCKNCSSCRKGFFKSQPDKYVCIGVKEPFVINNVDSHCTEYPEKQKQNDSEYILIGQAIESAKCRIYRLKQNEGSTLAHQKKAKNQQDLMKITIKALERYRDEL